MSKKLVTVFGATGNQGGSIISEILKHPELQAKYALRGVTRDPSKGHAQELTQRGVEVVKGDMSDPASLQAAVAGSYAVFGVTNFWELMSAETEEKQGRTLADAAFGAGVEHLIWSSLPSPKRLTDGKLSEITHFEGKNAVEQYIEAHKAKHGTKVSYFMPAVFMTQLKGMINPTPDGGRALAMHIDPHTTHWPLIDIRSDTGKWVAGLLEAGPDAADGVHVQAAGDWVSPDSLIKTINDVAGTKITFAPIPRDTFKSFLPAQIAEELTQNFDLIGDYSYYGKGTETKQVEADRYLLKGTKKTTWKDYVQQNGPWDGSQ